MLHLGSQALWGLGVPVKGEMKLGGGAFCLTKQSAGFGHRREAGGVLSELASCSILWVRPPVSVFVPRMPALPSPPTPTLPPPTPTTALPAHSVARKNAISC